MRDYVKVNQSAYNLTAPEYLERAGRPVELLEELASKPLTFLRSKEGNAILEIGPGSGEVCRYYANLGNTTTALDVSREMIANVERISPATKTITADVLEVALSPETYDLVYASRLIHLFTRFDANMVMRKIFRSLKPNGYLFIETKIFNTPEGGFAPKKNYRTPATRYRHHYTKSEFRSLILRNHFRIVDSIKTEEDQKGNYWQAYICHKPHSHWWHKRKRCTLDLC